MSTKFKIQKKRHTSKFTYTLSAIYEREMTTGLAEGGKGREKEKKKGRVERKQ